MGYSTNWRNRSAGRAVLLAVMGAWPGHHTECISSLTKAKTERTQEADLESSESEPMPWPSVRERPYGIDFRTTAAILAVVAIIEVPSSVCWLGPR